MGGLEFNAGEIEGKGNLNVSGAALWRGGAFSGTGITNFSDSPSITGTFTKSIDSGRVINMTDTTWEGNFAPNMNAIQLGIGGSAASIIHSSGTWNDNNSFGSYMARDYTDVSSTFENSGTYNKNGNAVTLIGVGFNSTGTTNVNVGNLALGGGGTSTGVFNLSANSALEFTGGTYNLDNVTISGAGTLDIRGNSIVNVNGGNYSPSVTIGQDGQLQGADNTFNGLATWTSGSIQGAGTTRFSSALSIAGDAEKEIRGERIIIVSDTTWGGNTSSNSNSILFDSGNEGAGAHGKIDNTGTWNDTNAFDSAMGGDNFLFHNGGIYNKQGNAATIIGGGYTNTGTTNVNAGLMVVAGSFSNIGIIQVNAGSAFQVYHVVRVGAGSHNSENDTQFINAQGGVLRGEGTVYTPLPGWRIKAPSALATGSAFSLFTAISRKRQLACSISN